MVRKCILYGFVRWLLASSAPTSHADGAVRAGHYQAVTRPVGAPDIIRPETRNSFRTAHGSLALRDPSLVATRRACRCTSDGSAEGEADDAVGEGRGLAADEVGRAGVRGDRCRVGEAGRQPTGPREPTRRRGEPPHPVRDGVRTGAAAGEQDPAVEDDGAAWPSGRGRCATTVARPVPTSMRCTASTIAPFRSPPNTQRAPPTSTVGGVPHRQRQVRRHPPRAAVARRPARRPGRDCRRRTRRRRRPGRAPRRR